jgi:glycosyltransferase involved in cell wall biosynthesis
MAGTAQYRYKHGSSNMNSRGSILPSISVVVATFNRADYLRVSLACLAAQDYEGEWQIIVADDGSTDQTPDVISEARSNSRGLEIQHCWHEHHNYRRAFILNEGSRRASGDILIFLDSDCIPAPNLLSTYAAHFTPDAFYLGGVYFLNQRLSETVLQGDRSFSQQEFWTRAAQWRNLKKGSAKRNFKRYWKSKLYIAFNLRKPKIWGGNCAVNHDAFEKINGYDENYAGYNKSDSDLRNRLFKGSYRAVPLQTKARAYHLYHQVEKWRTVPQIIDQNEHPYFKWPDPDVVCKNGLRKL